jgi:hypothetical protein
VHLVVEEKLYARFVTQQRLQVQPAICRWLMDSMSEILNRDHGITEPRSAAWFFNYCRRWNISTRPRDATKREATLRCPINRWAEQTMSNLIFREQAWADELVAVPRADDRDEYWDMPALYPMLELE